MNTCFGEGVPLLWMDLETTGLIKGQGGLREGGLILEASWLVTDGVIPLAGGTELVLNDRWPSDIMSPQVNEMHVESELYGDWGRGRARMTIFQIEQAILHDIHVAIGQTGRWNAAIQLQLSGFGPQFDRQWIEKFMPTLEGRLHYRNLDVRSLSTAETLRTGQKPGSGRKHRALPDNMEAYGFFVASVGWPVQA